MFAYIFIFIILIFTAFCVITVILLDEYRKKIKASWNETMSIWKIRYNTIASLIDFAKKYIPDKKAYYSILKAKSDCHTAKTPVALIAANKAFGEECGILLAMIKEIPSAENDEFFQKIHMDIISSEEKLAFERSFYGDYVKIYNRLIQTFPTSVVANLFKYRIIAVDFDKT